MPSSEPSIQLSSKKKGKEKEKPVFEARWDSKDKPLFSFDRAIPVTKRPLTEREKAELKAMGPEAVRKYQTLAKVERMNQKRREERKKRIQSKRDNINESVFTGTVYLSHLPHGFFEKQLRAFFAHFGSIRELRLLRNLRTGKSRHCAFIQFHSDHVAKIVCKAMNGYMMFHRTLVCELIAEDQLPENFWRPAREPKGKLTFGQENKQRSTRQHNRMRTVGEHQVRLHRLLSRERRRKRKLEKIGIDLDVKGYSEQLQETTPKHFKLDLPLPDA